MVAASRRGTSPDSMKLNNRSPVPVKKEAATSIPVGAAASQMVLQTASSTSSVRLSRPVPESHEHQPLEGLPGSTSLAQAQRRVSTSSEMQGPEQVDW